MLLPCLVGMLQARRSRSAILLWVIHFCVRVLHERPCGCWHAPAQIVKPLPEKSGSLVLSPVIVLVCWAGFHPAVLCCAVLCCACGVPHYGPTHCIVGIKSRGLQLWNALLSYALSIHCLPLGQVVQHPETCASPVMSTGIGLWVQVDFVPAHKVGKPGSQQPEQADPATDKHHDTDSSHDSPHSHHKRKRRGESDSHREDDSRSKHKRAHRRAEKEDTQDRHKDRDDRGHKDSRRRREDREGSSSENQEGDGDERHQNRRRRLGDNRSKEDEKVRAATAGAAAEDSR